MDELQKIKDKYGEQMMHFCRKEFPTILETPDLLFSILFSRFDYNKELYNDLKNSNLLGDFREYIFSEAHFESSQVETDKTPQELLKEAGYILYECKTKKDIDFFKKYFAKKESICTFRTNRLETSYVFFAVKENVKDIKRENFPNPKRQDEYGTSVISIQFYRGNVNSVKITNRYNHTVDNPDATFSNNLDNIIPGLTYAFEKQYGFKIDRYGEKRLIIPGYVQSSNLRFYRYNHKAGSTFFCPNNKIIFNSSEIKDYKEKERFLFADAYIFDLQRKKLIACNKEIEKDAFVYNIIDLDKIEILKEGENKLVRLVRKGKDDVYIELDKFGRIISYVNSNSTFIGKNFMKYNTALRHLELPNVEIIGSKALYKNEALEEIIMPKVKKIDSSFLYTNSSLRSLYLPSLEELGPSSLSNNRSISEIYIPNLQKLYDDVLWENPEAKEMLEKDIKSNVMRLKL